MKVLLIEDNEQLQNLFASMSKKLGVDLLQARTIREADLLFLEHKDTIDIIYIDGCVPGDKFNTKKLAEHIRKSFCGPMIAISAVENYNIELLRAGCNDMLMQKSDLMKHMESAQTVLQ